MSNQVRITEPSELRGLLLQTAVGILEGRVNVSQANAVVGCCSEVHKSIKQEWDMRVEYAAGLTIENGVVEKLLGSIDDE